VTGGDDARHIGFVGLGDQGAPMARAIAAAGFNLTVWARRAASVSVLDGLAHRVAATPEQLAAQSDIVLLCLRDDADLDDMLFDQGMLAAMRCGTVLVNHATGLPAASRSVAEAAAALGVLSLDAPVSGGGAGAANHTLTTIVGGDPDAFARALPVFETFSSSVVRMGGPGAGQTAKLLNNALTMSNLNNAVDVLRVAAALGLDIAALRHMLDSSSGGSYVLSALNRQIAPSLAPHLAALMQKDIEHFAEAMAAAGIDGTALRDRGLAGARGLVETTRLVADAEAGAALAHL
jgi:3-hydroxyisobutyrate dehydrogenase-like beta-hydroxyacid dehydrogenase